jgi:hypothetical protein
METPTAVRITQTFCGALQETIHSQFTRIWLAQAYRAAQALVHVAATAHSCCFPLSHAGSIAA